MRHIIVIALSYLRVYFKSDSSHIDSKYGKKHQTGIYSNTYLSK